MSEAFTPGPWRMKFEPPTPDYEYPYARIGAGEGYSQNGFELSGIIREADARLLASAPTMYRALERAVEVLEFAYMNAPKQPPEIAEGRAVLARARGEQS